jgi:hypothetical protein
MIYLWIALGSALGGVARYWCSGFAARRFGETLPWSTLLVNVLGWSVIGLGEGTARRPGPHATSAITRLGPPVAPLILGPPATMVAPVAGSWSRLASASRPQRFDGNHL